MSDTVITRQPGRPCVSSGNGVTDNLAGIKRFAMEAEKLLYKWVNRRGKRGCLNWEKFCGMLKRFPLPEPRIKVKMFGVPVE